MIDPRQRTLLRAGRLRLAFQDGRLQWLSVGAVEVVRRVYVALRDEAWTTVPFRIDRFDADVGEEAFMVSYDATATSTSGTFAFTVDVRGNAAGVLEMALHGRAETVLTTNRVGLCMHYPHELAGSALRSWRVDDPTERDASFPSSVEPSPPLKGLGGIAHPVDATTWCRASFHGDVFEMEDQRNFGDASFKVYSTPSDDPVPRVLQPGDRVEQRIHVELVDAPKRSLAPAAARRAPWFLGAATLERSTVDVWRRGTSTSGVRGASDVEPVVVEISAETIGVVPELGTDITRLCGAADDIHASRAAVRTATERLDALGVPNVRLELDLGSSGWSRACRLGMDLAAAARAKLDLVMRADAGAWPGDLPEWLAGHADRVATVCVAGPLDDADVLADRVRRLRRALQTAGADVPIGAGSVGWFIDVNGATLSVEELDFLAYALTPQVHVFDDDALRENLHGFEPPLAKARDLARGRDVRVGPVTLRPRGSEAGATDALWPTPRDPRLDHGFGAVWTLGAIARHAAGGAAALTLFELEGPEAVAGRARGDRPTDVPIIADVIRTLAPFAGSETLRAGSRSPLDAFAFGVRVERGGVCWLANPTGRPVEIDLRWPGPVEDASGPIRLRPFELQRRSWDDQG